jgi:dethiobiotin synthetase
MQTGGDSDRGYAEIRGVKTIPEAYKFDLPAAPAAAGRVERLEIPHVHGTLLIEGAGGALVPIREKYLWADWLAETALPTFLVARLYLGCIHHTLATVESLQKRGVKIIGLIFNDGKGDFGPSFPDLETRRTVLDGSRSFIVEYTGLPDLGRIPALKNDDASALRSIFEREVAPRLQNVEGFY